MTETFATIARNASEAAYPHLRRGLVGAWVPSLGVTGGTLRDVSGRGNHGTLTNMDPATDWKVSGGGWCLDFDGSNDNVVGAAQSLSGLSVLTVCVWYNPQTRKAYGGIVSTASQFSEAMATQWLLYDGAFSNAGRVGIVAGGAALFTAAGNSVLNEWQQYVAVFDGSSSKIYRNAVEQATTGSIGALAYDAATSLKLASYTATKGYNDCRISEVMVYNRALTAVEVQQLYQLGSGEIGRALTRQTRRRVYSVLGPAFKAAWATRATTIAGVLR